MLPFFSLFQHRVQLPFTKETKKQRRQKYQQERLKKKNTNRQKSTVHIQTTLAIICNKLGSKNRLQSTLIFQRTRATQSIFEQGSRLIGALHVPNREEKTTVLQSTRRKTRLNFRPSLSSLLVPLEFRQDGGFLFPTAASYRAQRKTCSDICRGALTCCFSQGRNILQRFHSHIRPQSGSILGAISSLQHSE